VWGQVTARDYHQLRVEELFPLVLECYQRLTAAHDIIVIEGAGSPAEINLKAHDIVNMRMAAAADAACLLVGDIDRGGVFASLLGTMALLDHRERQRVRGFVINKFRGDPDLLTSGVATIERRLRRPCLGVIPHLPAIGLDEEDSVALEDRRTPARAWRGVHATDPSDSARPLRVGVISALVIAGAGHDRRHRLRVRCQLSAAAAPGDRADVRTCARPIDHRSWRGCPRLPIL